jgi:branched-chain amino acid transport system permease protein
MLPTLHDLVQFVPLGLAVGAVYGVSGVGIVVLYRTTGVLNFAYGAVGALGVFIAYQLIFKTSWCPDWLAFLICVLFGGAVTLAYGLVFGPIFAARDPLVKAAATLGLTLILLALMSWIWPANQARLVPLPSDKWHHFGYQIGDVRISWTKIIALIFAVATRNSAPPTARSPTTARSPRRSACRSAWSRHRRGSSRDSSAVHPACFSPA